MAKGILIRAKPEKIEQWRLAAKARGVPLAVWIRQIANEECERQAALILYQIRVERPHEVNAIVEEILRQRAERYDPDRKLVPERAAATLAALRESTEVEERAADKESAGLRERAEEREGTDDLERAVTRESTVRLERAVERESTAIPERAADQESTEEAEHHPERPVDCRADERGVAGLA